MPRKKKSRLGLIRKYSQGKKVQAPSKKIESSYESDHVFAYLLLSDRFLTSEQDLPIEPTHENIEDCDSDGCQADAFYLILDKAYQYFPQDDLEEFTSSNTYRIYSELREQCKSIDHLGDFMYMKTAKDIKFIKLYDSDNVSNTPRVKLCLTVSRDFSVCVDVHGQRIPDSHVMWKNIDHTAYTIKSVKRLLCDIDKYTVCNGNTDNELQDIIPFGTFLDLSDGYKFQGYREVFYIGSTVRSTKCCMLINQISKRCPNCKTYRKTLKKTLTRQQSTEKVPGPGPDPDPKYWIKSKVPNVKLTESQKVDKLKQMRNYTNQLEQTIRWNIKRHIDLPDVDNTPLQKRKRHIMCKLQHPVTKEEETYNV